MSSKSGDPMDMDLDDIKEEETNTKSSGRQNQKEKTSQQTRSVAGSTGDEKAGNDEQSATNAAGSRSDSSGKPKVGQQVSIQTFWSAMEPYFRNITADDIKFLEEKVINLFHFSVCESMRR